MQPPDPRPATLDALPPPLLRELVRAGGGPYRHTRRRHHVAWLRARLGHLPVELWVEPDAVEPGTPAHALLRRWALRHPWQVRPVAESLRRCYLAPLLVNPVTLDGDVGEVWLDAQTLDDAVRQHTAARDDFHFWGVHRPHHRWTDAEAPVATADRQGLVVNTAPDPDGAHWVAAFLLPARRRWEYFDSQGAAYAPLPCVEALLARVAAEYGFAPAKWRRPRTPPQRHQRGVTQCGMYAAWYVTVRAWSLTTWAAVQTGLPIPDRDMRDLRAEWFRTPTPRLTQVLRARRADMLQET